MIPAHEIHEGIVASVTHRHAPIDFVTFTLAGSHLEFFASFALTGCLAPGMRVYASCLATPQDGRAVVDLLHCDVGGTIPESSKQALIRRRMNGRASRN